MALTCMSVHDTVEYVSDRDPAKKKTKVMVDKKDPSKGFRDEITIDEGATKFLLKPLDVFLMGYIYDNASSLSGKQGSDEIGIKTRVNQTNIDAVRHGLAGFINFKDTRGNDVTVSTVKVMVNGREYEVADDATLIKLGIQLTQELGAKVKEISEVSAAEEKNSDGASPL